MYYNYNHCRITPEIHLLSALQECGDWIKNTLGTQRLQYAQHTTYLSQFFYVNNYPINHPICPCTLFQNFNYVS